MVNPYRKQMNDNRQQLLALLEHEMRTNSAFVRIHAAEVLCEHGFGYKVAPLFLPEVETKTTGYRIGVWRVLARIASGEEERAQFVERIRRVMLDPAAPDRVGAAESLGKLGIGNRADREPLERWLATADDATAVFPLWVLIHSATAEERAPHEARLTALLDSEDVIARLRSAFVLGRLATISPEAAAQLSRRAAREPADTVAYVYVLAAAFLHTLRGSAPAGVLRGKLLDCLKTGKPPEQYEVGNVFGMRGATGDIPALTPCLKHPEADARIGVAGALLHLLK